jgi:hypothetical protein
MAYQLKGDLREDALGLWQHLSGRISPSDASSLNELYAVLHTSGLAVEQDTTRPEGASYNPRPARLARLLFDFLGKEIDPALLAAAFILGCYGDAPRRESLCERARSASDANLWQCAHDIASQASRALLGEAGVTGAELSSPIATLAAIKILDDVRHLHQRSLEGLARKDKLADYLASCQRLRAIGAEERVLVLIEAAGERLQRRREFRAT